MDKHEELANRIKTLEETNRRLNRRCQEAESVANETVDKCKKAGVSLGRALANYGYKEIERKYEALKASHEKMKDALERIDNWAKAYPVEVFPKPTKDNWKQAAEVLKANGLILDRFSADNKRQVLEGVKSIAEQALKEADEI